MSVQRVIHPRFTVVTRQISPHLLHVFLTLFGKAPDCVIAIKLAQHDAVMVSKTRHAGRRRVLFDATLSSSSI